MATASKLAAIPTPSCGYYMGDDLLTAEDVAAWLKVPKSWVHEQIRHRAKVRSKHPLPHTRAGKYPKFSRMRIAEWLLENES